MVFVVPSPGHRRRHGSHDTTDAPVIDGDDLKPQSPKAGGVQKYAEAPSLTGEFYVGLLDGLLGVAGNDVLELEPKKMTNSTQDSGT